NSSRHFGDENYAKEELRAELASVFLAAERGIPHNPANHAAYVGSWIKALQDDKNEIFRAAKDAHRATDFLIALEVEKSVEAALRPRKIHSLAVKHPNTSLNTSPVLALSISRKRKV